LYRDTHQVAGSSQAACPDVGRTRGPTAIEHLSVRAGKRDPRRSPPDAGG
jgi:hypothetical protein